MVHHQQFQLRLYRVHFRDIVTVDALLLRQFSAAPCRHAASRLIAGLESCLKVHVYGLQAHYAADAVFCRVAIAS